MKMTPAVDAAMEYERARARFCSLLDGDDAAGLAGFLRDVRRLALVGSASAADVLDEAHRLVCSGVSVCDVFDAAADMAGLRFER